MNMLKLVSLTTFTLAALLVVPAFSQSVANSPKPLDPASLLLARAGAHAPAQKWSPAQDAIAQGLAKAKVYKFTSADYPGANSSIVYQENDGIAIGTAEFGGILVGFTLKGRDYELFNLTGGQTFVPAGINAAGQIVGTYYDLNGVWHGFLDTAGVVSNLDVPGASLGTEPTGINDAGEIVGTYYDSNGLAHGFSTPDKGVSFTTLDFPGALLTLSSSVNNAGDVVGFWQDAGSRYHGFLWRNGAYESLDFPLANATAAYGINDSGAIAGFFDSNAAEHGFVYARGTFFQVDVPGAAGTVLNRVANNGQVAGLYWDAKNESHGVLGH